MRTLHGSCQLTPSARRTPWVWIWLALGVACSGGERPDGGGAVAVDATVAPDAGHAPQDAGAQDAEGVDAGAPDAGMVDAGSSDAGQPDAGVPTGEVRVANRQGTCGSLEVLFPNPGEEGHWAAVRLTPPGYPFEVRAVDFPLLTGRPSPGVECVSSFEHRVALWVVEDVQPAATPVVDRTLDVVGAGAIPAFEPLRVEAGQHLMVAVELAGTGGRTTCLQLCPSSPSAANRNFWSNATQPPFSWAELSDFGITANVELGVTGEVLR